MTSNTSVPDPVQRGPAHSLPSPGGRLRRWTLLLLAVAVSGCGYGPEGSTRLDVGHDVTIVIVDELGDVVPTATFDSVTAGEFRADESGTISLPLHAPIAGVINAPGKLPEPIAVAPRDRRLSVTLIDRVGPEGERIALHFGGDTMVGRRYQEPTRTDTPVVTDAAAARALVSDLAPIAAAADATVVNLETVVGDLPVDDSHPGKKYLLQTPPYALDALTEMGVDLVTLGNNHINDWQAAGLQSTVAALDAAGIPHVGAADDPDAARRGTVLRLGALDIGVVSLTTSDGDAVNDHLPLEASTSLAGVSDRDRWQYEARAFGFGAPGDPGYIPDSELVAGAAWETFSTLEPTLTPDRVAELWAALTSPAAYPELQDWVARRGHGGAARYQANDLRDEVARLESEGADFIVVQFHSGFQFMDSPSAASRSMAAIAIDAGADAVISHHPHVLQGVEWYEGKPIVYSLGNLVFDQNFLTTSRSAILRVVVDSGGLVEARLLPVMLDAYRPVPAAGDAADRIIRQVATNSRSTSEPVRVPGLGVVTAQLPGLPDGFETATILPSRNSGLIERASDGANEMAEFAIFDGKVTTTPVCLQIRTNDLPAGVEYGVDVFGWGAFDDGLADGSRGSVMHWRLPTNPDDWGITQGASPDESDDALVLQTNSNRLVETRNVSLMPVAVHSTWLPDLSAPADAGASYSLSADLRRVRGEPPTARVVAYRVADEDVSRDPETFMLRETRLPLDVPDDGDWHRVEVELDAAIFEPVDGESVDGLFVYIETPPAFRGSLAIDNLRVYEWRAAPSGELALWSEVDALRSDRDQTVSVLASGCESV